jgi:hypothetical protein
MRLVEPDERAAAASVTNRSAQSRNRITRVRRAFLLDQSTFGWPLVIGGRHEGDLPTSSCYAAHRRDDFSRCQPDRRLGTVETGD